MFVKMLWRKGRGGKRMMEQLSLFDDRERSAPLASRLRPESLDEYVGQRHLIGEGKILRRLIGGPAGGGKDYPGKNYCQADKGGVCGVQCGNQRD